MTNCKAIQLLFQRRNFPLVEALYSTSSNVNGDTVYAHAITRVNVVDEATRLDYLAKLLPLGGLSEAVDVKGLSFTKTEKWTIADELIREHDKFKDKNFLVIWITSELLDSDYRGNAGSSLHKLRGIVIRYPGEKINMA